MKPICLSFGVLALALLPPTLFAGPPGEKDAAAYYPLKVGNSWTYKVGPNKVLVRVVRIEAGVAHIESSSAGGKVTLIEKLQIGADGIYRLATNDKKVTPPLRFLSLPTKKGNSWEIDSKTGDETMKGTFKVEEVAEVSVGDKKYPNVVVVTGEDLDANGTKISLVTHYARDVGMIKQTLKAGDQTILLELESFEVGPFAAPVHAANQALDLMVGKWEPTNSKQKGTVEFTKDNKVLLKIEGPDGKVVEITGTYKFIGDGKVEVELTFMGRRQKEDLKVTVTKDELTTIDLKDKKETFRRVK